MRVCPRCGANDHDGLAEFCHSCGKMLPFVRNEPLALAYLEQAWEKAHRLEVLLSHAGEQGSGTDSSLYAAWRYHQEIKTALVLAGEALNGRKKKTRRKEI